MLLSFSIFQTTFHNYKQYKDSYDKKENYSNLHKRKGLPHIVYSGMLLLSIIFLILELSLMFHAIKMAMNCTKKGRERTIHLHLAILFTIPYTLFSVFLSKCGSSTLREEGIESVLFKQD